MALFDRIAMTDPARGVDVARELAASLAPPPAPPGPDPEVAFRSLTAEVVGGDFTDVLPGAHGGVTVVIGDVSGAGPLTALFMAMTTCLLRILAQDELPPGRMLELANRILQPHLARRGMLVTAQVLHYRPDARTLAVASAGHLWPYIMRRDGGCTELEVQGVPLGVLPESAYEVRHETVTSGDRMLLYTDGLVECTDRSGERFGFERLSAALAGAATTGAPELVRSLLARFAAFIGAGRRRDDVSVVALAWS